jgi:thiol-disulfide isomerase/thioredoxin
MQVEGGETVKKIIVYAIVIVLLFGGLYAVNVASGGSDDNPYGIREGKLSADTRKLLDDPLYQNIILPDELKTRLSEGYTGFVYFFSASCVFCKQTTPVLKPMADELGVDLPMFNLLEFPEGWQEYGITHTPTLVYFKDGVEADRIVGGVELEEGDGGVPRDVFRAFLSSRP